MLEKILSTIGLSEKESKVYLKLLEFGSLPISVIAKHTNINRTTCYIVIKKLANKGIVSKYEKFNIQYFSAAQPHVLMSYLKDKKSKVENEISILENNLEKLNKIEDRQNNKTKVLYYEGFEGVKNIYEDNLQDNNLIRTFVGLEKLTKQLSRYLKEDYLVKRINKEIIVKAIVSQNELGSMFDPSEDKDSFRSRKVIPGDKKLSSQISIYKDKVSFISYYNEDYKGVVIQDASFAETMKSVFDALDEKI